MKHRLLTLWHILQFVFQRKRFWMAPLMLMLLLLGALMVFTQGSVLAPFIYTLF